MIHALFLTLRDALKAKGVPFEVVYGPKPVPMSVGATRVQVLRDYDASEQIGAARAPGVNPRRLAIRAVPGIVRIFARAVVAGAGPGDHEALADAIADQCQVEIHKAARAVPTLYAITSAGLTDRLDVPDGWAGAVYELKFTMDRGVRDTDWLGHGLGEMTMTATTAKTAIAHTGGTAGSGDLPSATTRIDP